MPPQPLAPSAPTRPVRAVRRRHTIGWSAVFAIGLAISTWSSAALRTHPAWGHRLPVSLRWTLEPARIPTSLIVATANATVQRDRAFAEVRRIDSTYTAAPAHVRDTLGAHAFAAVAQGRIATARLEEAQRALRAAQQASGPARWGPLWLRLALLLPVTFAAVSLRWMTRRHPGHLAFAAVSDATVLGVLLALLPTWPAPASAMQLLAGAVLLGLIAWRGVTAWRVHTPAVPADTPSRHLTH